MDDGVRGGEAPGGALSGGTYRVDARLLAGDWWILLLLAADAAFGFWAWSRLPARVPTHWGLDGQPDGWGPSWLNALLIPATAIFLYLLVLLLPLIDPRRRNYALFPGVLRLLRFLAPSFMVVLHVLAVRASLGLPVDMSLAFRVLLPVFFILLGNQLGRIRFNYFVGIRVPWTLDNEEVWNRTHRLAGKLWVGAGVLALGAVFLPPVPGTITMAVVIGLATLVPVVYSCWISRGLHP